jgi:hypothetical protein
VQLETPPAEVLLAAAAAVAAVGVRHPHLLCLWHHHLLHHHLLHHHLLPLLLLRLCPRQAQFGQHLQHMPGLQLAAAPPANPALLLAALQAQRRHPHALRLLLLLLLPLVLAVPWPWTVCVPA